MWERMCVGGRIYYPSRSEEGTVRFSREDNTLREVTVRWRPEGRRAAPEGTGVGRAGEARFPGKWTRKRKCVAVGSSARALALRVGRKRKERVRQGEKTSSLFFFETFIFFSLPCPDTCCRGGGREEERV